MSPLQFIDWFRQRLHDADIQFAITSGQACVYYGIQQATKDSDWIIEESSIPRLTLLLQEIDQEANRRVVFRGVCGAPLDCGYLGRGWTTHISLIERDQEHHLDFFSKAPRVRILERDATCPDYASRSTVAAMKQTDREKDWPMVYSLGRQAFDAGDVRGILFGQDHEWLQSKWHQIPAARRSELESLRPLLRQVDSLPSQLKRSLLLERAIWQQVNRSRYSLYLAHWNNFFRRWKLTDGFQWPLPASFATQLEYLTQAAMKHELPQEVITVDIKRQILAQAVDECTTLFNSNPQEMDRILPPIELLLP